MHMKDHLTDEVAGNPGIVGVGSLRQCTSRYLGRRQQRGGCEWNIDVLSLRDALEVK